MATKEKKNLNNEELLPHLRDFIKDTAEDWNYITPEEYKKMRESGKADDYFLLDIRKPEDFKKGHIPGAHNIFWMDILKPENLKKLPKNKKIIIYCYVGHTSSQVLVLLKLLGYDVISLKFGIGKSPVEGVPVAGWSDFGYDTTKEASMYSKLSSMIDEVADRLEKECLFKEAEELDIISNTLEKMAAIDPYAAVLVAHTKGPMNKIQEAAEDIKALGKKGIEGVGAVGDVLEKHGLNLKSSNEVALENLCANLLKIK